MADSMDGSDNMFYSDSEDNGISFQRHNEYMKKFRFAHPGFETIDSKGVRTADLLALLPVQQVKLIRFSQN